MNRMFKLALIAVLGSALVVPAFAQDMYKDVPENHWAYDAIKHLKTDGILVDDGSGKFLGRCNVTRYEMAVTIDRAYRVLLAKFADQQEQINALKAAMPTGSAPTVDNTAIQKQLDDLSARLTKVEGWATDIQTLQRLTGEFQKELSALGANVEEMKTKLSSLDDRVTALEKKKSILEISGKADLAVLAGHSTDGHYGLLYDGSVTGYNRASRGGGTVGLTKDVTVLHQLAVNFDTTNEEGPKLHSTLIVGNTLGTLGANTLTRDATAQTFGAFSNFNDANTDVYFQEMYATWNANLAGQGVSAKVGRFGWKVGQYLYQRPAYTEQYFSDDYRDNGEYTMDGAAIGFGFGKATATVAFGRSSNLNSTNGIDTNSIVLGANAANPGTVAKVDTTLGVQLKFPIGEAGKVNLAYLLHDSFGNVAAPAAFGGGTYDRIQTYGADAKFKFSSIDFGAAYSKASLYDNNSSKVDSDNAAWDVNAKFGSDKFKVGGGFRHVEKNFAALSDTGRFGTYYNPRNFEGFNVNATFTASPDVEFYGKGEFVKGLGAAGIFATPLGTTDDKIQSYTLGVNYKVNSAFDLGLSYEDVKFQNNGLANAKERWYTLGLGFNMSANSKLSFKYIYSDADLAGRNALGGAVPAGANAPGNDGIYRGGLLATQVSVKF